MARLQPAQLDWDYLLDSRVLHLTGITPALSPNCREIIAEAIERARTAGVFISFDVNYRRLLWTPGEAAATLRPLIAQTNLLICGEADASELFGLQGDSHQTLAALAELTGAEVVVMTRGDDDVMALEGDSLLEQPARPATVVDRLGAGDAFAAGLLDGWLDGSLAAGLERGTALAALALAQEGDMLVVNRAELEAMLADDNRGVVR